MTKEQNVSRIVFLNFNFSRCTCNWISMAPRKTERQVRFYVRTRENPSLQRWRRTSQWNVQTSLNNVSMKYSLCEIYDISLIYPVHRCCNTFWSENNLRMTKTSCHDWCCFCDIYATCFSFNPTEIVVLNRFFIRLYFIFCTSFLQTQIVSLKFISCVWWKEETRYYLFQLSIDYLCFFFFVSILMKKTISFHTNLNFIYY